MNPLQQLRERPGPFAAAAIVAAVVWAWFARPPVFTTLALLMVIGTIAAFLTNGRYALRRILGIVPILLIVSFVVFSLMASLPGDPAINILGPAATPDAVARINAEMGLDQPFFNRYGNWLGDAVMGDLGESVQLREEVSAGIGRTITVSLQLMAYGLILAVLIAFPLGVYTAYRNGTRQDRTINTIMLGFFAVPSFVLAITMVLFLAIGGFEVESGSWIRFPIILAAVAAMVYAAKTAVDVVRSTDSIGRRVIAVVVALVVVFVAWRVMRPFLSSGDQVQLGFKILPGARYVPFGQDISDHFKHMLLPSVSLALGISAVFMRLLRSDMIATLRLPFIDLARSKGVSPSRILWRHALRPSVFTLLTVMGFTVGALIGGSLINEIIFGLPGIGSYMFGAIIQRDFIVVQGGTMVIATLYILILTMVDFLYLAIDPRLRTGGGGGLGGS